MRAISDSVFNLRQTVIACEHILSKQQMEKKGENKYHMFPSLKNTRACSRFEESTHCIVFSVYRRTPGYFPFQFHANYQSSITSFHAMTPRLETLPQINAIPSPNACSSLRSSRSRTAISALLCRRVKILELVASNVAVLHRRVEALLARRQADREVGVCSELDDEEREVGELHLQERELLRALWGTSVAAGGLLEVFDDVAEALEAVGGRVHCTDCAAPGGHDKEGGALEEQNFLRLNHLAQFAEMLLDLVEVRDEIVNDFSPGLVEGLVPYGCSKRDWSEGVGLGSDESNSVIVDIFALVRDDQIHLVHEDVDARGGRELTKGSDDGAVCKEVAVEVSGLDIEDIDEDTNVGEHMLSLLGEVVFHEGILSARRQHWSGASDDMKSSSTSRRELCSANQWLHPTIELRCSQC